MRLILAIVLAAVTVASAAEVKPLYENDFSQAQLEQVPDDFLVLNGTFAVKEEGGNRFLELPGAPVDAYGLLFGPTVKDGVAVTAREFATAKGRRLPAIGIGLNGAGGYRLQITPSKKALEIYKGDEVKATTPFEWASGQWTWLRLQVRKVTDSKWQVEGKAWTDGSAEPKEWNVAWEETEAPAPGRASIWGSPYSGTPIRFDDLSVRKL